MCEKPAQDDVHLNIVSHKDKHTAEEEIEKINLVENNITNPCDIFNPCQNNGSCLFDYKKQISYCKCTPGFTNENCTDVSEFDPCLTNPCQNGGTCQRTNKTKSSYECLCPKRITGMNCELKPCDPNPCLNNGTCRTTRGSNTFFCDCINNYGGKICDHKIGETKKEEYGKNVKLISSGDIEWVEEIKKQFAKKKTKNNITGPLADEPEKEESTDASHATISGPAAQVGGKNGGELTKSSSTKHYFLNLPILIVFFISLSHILTSSLLTCHC